MEPPSSSGAPRPEPPAAAEPAPELESEPPAVVAGEQEEESGDPSGASLSMTTAHLARFEFSDAGTKILMVEWLPGAAAVHASEGGHDGQQEEQQESADAQSRSAAAAAGPDPGAGGEPPSSTDSASGAGAGARPLSDAAAAPWEVSWPGKSTFLPARDADVDTAHSSSSSSLESEERRRVFFLLPPDAPIPTTVTITPPGRKPIQVKPLPAIFPEGFHDDTVGPRGVLHTMWAKKRIRELDREMDAEMRTNAESVGLQMALAEKQWIVDNFLHPPPGPSVAAGVAGMTPITPRSPVSGRLGEKLKGLRLATSPTDLVPSPTANTFTSASSQPQTLSPQGGDIAVPSFSAIPPAQAPPAGASGGAPISLNAAVKGDTAGAIAAAAPQTDEEELFALPISPRSPDMKKSPFSML